MDYEKLVAEFGQDQADVIMGQFAADPRLQRMTPQVEDQSYLDVVRNKVQSTGRSGLDTVSNAGSAIGDYFSDRSPMEMIGDVRNIGQNISNAASNYQDGDLGRYIRGVGQDYVDQGASGYQNLEGGVTDNMLGALSGNQARINRGNQQLGDATTQLGSIALDAADIAFPAMGAALGSIKGTKAALRAAKKSMLTDIATPAGELMPYADVPVIDPRDLIGATISHTPADLTRAGAFYGGTDAAGTTRNTPLLGGPLFPLQKEYADRDIAWAVQGGPTAIQKLNNDADYVAVSAMGQNAHQSNASIADAYMGTLEAHIKDGRLSGQSIDELNNLVRSSASKSADPELQKLKNFVGFNDPLYDEYQSGLTFPQRAAISKLMTTPAAQKIGGPNFQKILDKTIQPEFAGTNLGDMLMLLEIDKKRGVLDLAAEGAPTHPSYKHGVGGKVVARFENPISRDLLLPEKVNEYSSRPTMRDENGTVIQSRLNYSLGKSRSPEKVTPESARNMMEAIQYQNINNPKQASLIQDAMNSNWKSSFTAKNAGGVSHVDYERALKRNPSLPSLEPYNVDDLKAGKKAGDFEVQQLGDSEIYFGLKKNPDYTWMNDGNAIPELGDNEVSLVGVISNEASGKGVASPAVLGKAIEDGATVLDAFAVPSKKYPDGFLPEVYGDYGFDEVKRIPFIKDYYIEDKGETAFTTLKNKWKANGWKEGSAYPDPSFNKEEYIDKKGNIVYNDLIHQWRSEGWDESKGFPDVLLMKWSGTDGQRKNASKRVFEESFEGFGSGEGRGIIPQTSGDARQISGAASGQQTDGSNIGRSNIGQARNNSGPRKPNRIRKAATELGALTPLQRQNLGLLEGIAKPPN